MKKKSGKNPELIPCPFCRKGKAINNDKAWTRSQANKYIRRRKEIEKEPPKRLPIVVHSVDIEAALVNSDFLQRIQPPSPPEPRTAFDKFLDSRLATIGIFVVGIVLFFLLASWLEEWGLDSENASDWTGIFFYVVLLGGFYGWYLIERRLETSDMQDYKKQLHQYQMTWVCLGCHRQFLIESESKKYKHIYNSRKK